MTPEQLKTIKEALELSRASWRSLCREDMVDVIDDALAIIASIEGEGADPAVHVHTVYDAVGGGYICSGCEQRFTTTTQPAKVLTDRVMHEMTKEAGIPYRHADNRLLASDVAMWVLRQVKSRGYLAPAPPVDIDRIMEVVLDHRANVYKIKVPQDRGYSEYVDSVLRTRLTNALTPKP